VTIVGATSGDTGLPPIEAFRGLDQKSMLFILFPHGRVSDVQRRQMTTHPKSKRHALRWTVIRRLSGASEGYASTDHASATGVQLAGVNSIKLGRRAGADSSITLPQAGMASVGPQSQRFTCLQATLAISRGLGKISRVKWGCRLPILGVATKPERHFAPLPGPRGGYQQGRGPWPRSARRWIFR